MNDLSPSLLPFPSFFVISSSCTSCSYAYGMGGLEKVAFDSKEAILYGVSEQGFVSSVMSQYLMPVMSSCNLVFIVRLILFMLPFADHLD